ncbi:MAG: elongation factor Ts [Alphaproteobacteria bacterium]|nr:elongation factor Ts [Alphaproteobacteria bacterium]
MAEITAGLVKELRQQTGAGMMDCKKALTESSGDLEMAVDWLRKKGLSAAAKKAGRVAAEGLVAALVDGRRGVLVEVNSETDFVARNEIFQEFVASVAQIALVEGGDLEKIKVSNFPATGRTVEEELAHQIATIGENMTLRRVASVSVDSGIVASYVHNQAAPGLGKIGVLVGLESTADEKALALVGKQLAMHVAAANPQAIERTSVDSVALDREREVLAEQARASGKPEEIIEKMVEGRLRKFYEEVVLLEQTFVVDGESKVQGVLDVAGEEAGAPINVGGFVRFALGEGIEKPD